MKINLHKSTLYLYVNVDTKNTLRKISIFEDFDETFFNYNLDSKKKFLGLSKKDKFLDKPKNLSFLDKPKNFFFEFFIL